MNIRSRYYKVLIFTIVISFAGGLLSFMGVSTPEEIKVIINTNQKGVIIPNVVVNDNQQDKIYSINLKNPGSDQNLKDIDVTITAGIPEGTSYMIGADEMLRSEGNMIQAQTGKPTRNNNNNMYLMFKRGANDYLLVGVVSWRTYLCQIYEENGSVKIVGDGDNKLLKAGQSSNFEKIVCMHDKSWQDLLDRYADVIAKENNAPIPPNVTWKGWATWDYYVQYFLASDVERNSKDLASLNVKPNIIQIDGGWWKQRGDYFDVDVRDNLPGGIKSMVEKIHKDGYKAGLHFDGFRVSKGAKIVKEHPDYFVHTVNGDFVEDRQRDPVTKDPTLIWDYSNPGATDYIRSVMKNARENWGVDYFKIDFMRRGLSKGVNFLPITNVERYRLGIKAMDEGIGNGYFLACSPSFGVNMGLIEATRTGPDIQPNYESVKISVQHNSGNYYFSNKLYNCDPDYLVLRSKEESNEKDGKNPSLTIEEANMWANYVSIFGNVRFESDEISLLKPEKKKVIERTMAMPFFNKAIPMDFWEHFKTDIDAPNFFLARGNNGEICVGLFNWNKTDTVFTVSGFKQTANLKEFNGSRSIKISNSKFSVPLDGVHSILLEYQGKESFDALKKQLMLSLPK